MMLTRRLLKKTTVAGCVTIGLLAILPARATEDMLQTDTSVSAATSIMARLQSELPAGIKPHFITKLASLYHNNNMQPMWQNKQASQQFQQQLAEVAISGVQPQFAQWAEWITDPKMTSMARDIVLSDAMLGYLQFTSEVPAHGEQWLYGARPYKLALPSISVINQWQRAIAEGKPDNFIAGLAPRHPCYQSMHNALKGLLAHEPLWPQLKDTTTLRPGKMSQDVPALREILQRINVLIDTPAFHSTSQNTVVKAQRVTDGSMAHAVSSSSPAKQSAPADCSLVTKPYATDTPVAENIYTSELADAVKRFQRWQGLQSDGLIGPLTRQWLNASPHMRVALLALNIQRLRLFPNDMRNGIMVNIPNYSLVYYDNGNPILASRVIVGRVDRKTPLMHSALDNVVLNPPWNVPVTLVHQDILPKVKNDPAYLSRHNYQLLSSWGPDAQLVDPAMIDWSLVSAANFPYRIRQIPGSTNSLGNYKFNMPNSDAIYLHDTPNHRLFLRDSRALSSGCVRVNKAPQLANLLLQRAGWNASRIATALKAGDTRYVAVRQLVPVSLYYLTAWVNADGKLQFRTDIYNYDSSVRVGMRAIYSAGKLLM